MSSDPGCAHCQSSLAAVFCLNDGVFLCKSCDVTVHNNRITQRHVRVPHVDAPPHAWAQYEEAATSSKAREGNSQGPMGNCESSYDSRNNMCQGSSESAPGAMGIGTPDKLALPHATTALSSSPALDTISDEVQGQAQHSHTRAWGSNAGLHSHSHPMGHHHHHPAQQQPHQQPQQQMQHLAFPSLQQLQLPHDPQQHHLQMQAALRSAQQQQQYHQPRSNSGSAHGGLHHYGSSNHGSAHSGLHFFGVTPPSPLAHSNSCNVSVHGGEPSVCTANATEGSQHSLAAMLERCGMPSSRDTSHHNGCSSHQEGSVHSTGNNLLRLHSMHSMQQQLQPPHSGASPFHAPHAAQAILEHHDQQQRAHPHAHYAAVHTPSSLQSSQTDLVASSAAMVAGASHGLGPLSGGNDLACSVPMKAPEEDPMCPASAAQPHRLARAHSNTSMPAPPGDVPLHAAHPHPHMQQWPFQQQPRVHPQHTQQQQQQQQPNLVTRSSPEAYNPDATDMDVQVDEPIPPGLTYRPTAFQLAMLNFEATPQSVIEARAKALISSSSRTKTEPPAKTGGAKPAGQQQKPEKSAKEAAAEAAEEKRAAKAKQAQEKKARSDEHKSQADVRARARGRMGGKASSEPVEPPQLEAKEGTVRGGSMQCNDEEVNQAAAPQGGRVTRSKQAGSLGSPRPSAMQRTAALHRSNSATSSGTPAGTSSTRGTGGSSRGNTSSKGHVGSASGGVVKASSQHGVGTQAHVGGLRAALSRAEVPLEPETLGRLATAMAANPAAHPTSLLPNLPPHKHEEVCSSLQHPALQQQLSAYQQQQQLQQQQACGSWPHASAHTLLALAAHEGSAHSGTVFTANGSLHGSLHGGALFHAGTGADPSVHSVHSAHGGALFHAHGDPSVHSAHGGGALFHAGAGAGDPSVHSAHSGSALFGAAEPSVHSVCSAGLGNGDNSVHSSSALHAAGLAHAHGVGASVHRGGAMALQAAQAGGSVQGSVHGSVRGGSAFLHNQSVHGPVHGVHAQGMAAGGGVGMRDSSAGGLLESIERDMSGSECVGMGGGTGGVARSQGMGAGGVFGGGGVGLGWGGAGGVGGTFGCGRLNDTALMQSSMLQQQQRGGLAGGAGAQGAAGAHTAQQSENRAGGVGAGSGPADDLMAIGLPEITDEELEALYSIADPEAPGFDATLGSSPPGSSLPANLRLGALSPMPMQASHSQSFPTTCPDLGMQASMSMQADMGRPPGLQAGPDILNPYADQQVSSMLDELLEEGTDL